MKFTDGNWLIREGVRIFYPTEARDRTVTANSAAIYATRHIRHRGDTLTGPLLTVQCSSPLPDVIRVRITHFAGGRPLHPQFELHAEHAP